MKKERVNKLQNRVGAKAGWLWATRPRGNMLQRAALLVTAVALSLMQTAPVLALSTSDIKSVLNNTSFYDPTNGVQTCESGSSTDSVSLNGSDPIEKAFNFFRDKGLSDIEASAAVGNLRQESSLNPIIMQKGGTSKNPADADSGTPANPDWTGWGIAQWSPGSKIIGIAKDLNITGPIYELSTQLQIVHAEMTGIAPTGYKDVLGGMKGLDLTQATEFFRKYFEGGTPGNRQLYASQIMAQYGGGGGGVGSSGSTTPVTGTNAGCGTTGAVDCTGTADTSGLSQTRQNAVCLARAELNLWESGKLKPGGSEPYDFYKYSQGRDENWCADFVSWVYNQAGYPLSGTEDGNVPAVQTIWDIGSAGGKFTYHAAGSYVPVPGDMIIHKDGQSHVNMVVSVNQNSKTMTTIGGNQDGSSTANYTSKVTQYDIEGYSGVNGITGYVSPTE